MPTEAKTLLHILRLSLCITTSYLHAKGTPDGSGRLLGGAATGLSQARVLGTFCLARLLIAQSAVSFSVAVF